MKKIIIIVIVAFLGFTTFSGCTRSSSSSSTSTTGSMTATIGSTAMNGTICVASEVSGALGISGSTVTSGVGGPPQINFTITNWSGGTGSVTLGSSSASNFAEYIQSSSSLALFSTSGTLNINSVSTTNISGTFSFTLSTGVTVSSGTFSAIRH